MSKPDPRAFQLLEADEHHAKATAFNMLFVLWCKETRIDAFRRANEALLRLGLAYPEGVGVCHIIESSAVPPTSEARSELSKMIKQGAEGNLKHYSVLYEGSGFKAASIRAVVSAAHMVARASTNLSVFGSLADAASWHSEQQRLIGRTESAREIAATIRQLRELYAEHAGEAARGP